MKDISFALNGELVTAKLGSRVEKKDLYGFSKTVAEHENIPLTRGYLLADGRLLTRQQISYARLDPEGTPIEDAIVELNGEVATLQPSSFDIENPLEPVPLSTLADFNVADIYPVEEVDIPEGLYLTQFNYRKTYIPKEAYLLVKSDQAFLLIGEMKKTAFVGLTVAYDFFDAEVEEEEEDELDFSMF
jgi:hypothetical protein